MNLSKNRLISKEISGGHTYWDNKSSAVVVRDPKHPDGGTVLKPIIGKKYFDDVLK